MARSSFARAHRYTVVDRPRVDLLADPTVERTDIRVDARFAEAGRRRAAGTARSRLNPEHEPAVDDIDPTLTRVYTIPRPRTPRAVLRVTDPDGKTRGGRRRRAI